MVVMRRPRSSREMINLSDDDSSTTSIQGPPLRAEYRSSVLRVATQTDAPISDTNPTLVSGGVKREADYNTIVTDHYTQIATRVRDPQRARLAGKEALFPGTTVASDGSAILRPRISDFLPTDVVVDGSAATMAADSFLILGQESILTATGVVSGDRSTQSSIDAIVASQINGTVSADMDAVVSTGQLEVVSFRMSPDVSPVAWGLMDRRLAETWELGNYLFLAVRVKLSGSESISAANLRLEFSHSTSSTENDLNTPWYEVDAGTFVGLLPPFNPPKVTGSAINPVEFVCNPGGGTPVPGVFVSQFQIGVDLNPGEETELWFSLIPSAAYLNEWLYGRIVDTTGAASPSTDFAPAGAWAGEGTV